MLSKQEFKTLERRLKFGNPNPHKCKMAKAYDNIRVEQVIRQVIKDIEEIDNNVEICLDSPN